MESNLSHLGSRCIAASNYRRSAIILAGLLISMATCQARDLNELKIGFFSTSNSVREQLLQITPVGSSLNDVLQFAERTVAHHEISTPPHVEEGGAQRHTYINEFTAPERIGVKRLVFGCHYKVLFGLLTYGLRVEYGFDSRDRVEDIVVDLFTPNLTI
jgi:hypothetical protein